MSQGNAAAPPLVLREDWTAEELEKAPASPGLRAEELKRAQAILLLGAIAEVYEKNKASEADRNKNLEDTYRRHAKLMIKGEGPYTSFDFLKYTGAIAAKFSYSYLLRAAIAQPKEMLGATMWETATTRKNDARAYAFN